MAHHSHASLWNNYMRSYDFLERVDGYVQNLKDIVKAAQPTHGLTILDAGSGTGNLSLLLKSTGANVVSCDFSQNAIDIHRAKDSDAVVVRTSLEETLPFENEAFDSVVCASVLFTLTNRGCRLALSEFYRVLKPGGRIVVTATMPQQKNKNLVSMHLKSVLSQYGMIVGIPVFMMQLPSLIQVLYYNSQLAKLPDWSGFHRFTKEELQEYIQGAGFSSCIIGVTYGGFLYLAEAVKS